jgi:hypothetical protein
VAIIQGLLALLTRSIGRVLNTAFGWATVMLFGKVPEDRQIYLSVVTFGSVAWLLVVIGIAFPSAGTFLLSFVPLPDWVSRNVVRLVMLGAALVLPLIVGFVSLRMVDPEQRPKGGGATTVAVLKGYPYTFGLALTLVMMTVFAPAQKLRTLAKRWTTQHVPVVITADHYLEVVGDLQRALEARGWQIERTRASWMLRLPTRVLTLLAGSAVDRFVARQLTMLRSEALEVVIHPSDLVINGPEHEATHARSTIAEGAAFMRAYMTWTKEAQEVEDRLSSLHESFPTPDALAEVERTIERLPIAYEEWEVLFRKLLLVERGMRRGRVPGEGIAVTTGLGFFAGWLWSVLSRRDREAVEDVADRLAA